MSQTNGPLGVFALPERPPYLCTLSPPDTIAPSQQTAVSFRFPRRVNRPTMALSPLHAFSNGYMVTMAPPHNNIPCPLSRDTAVGRHDNFLFSVAMLRASARFAVAFRIRRSLCRAASRRSALSASGSTSTARRPAAPAAGSRVSAYTGVVVSSEKRDCDVLYGTAVAGNQFECAQECRVERERDKDGDEMFSMILLFP